MNDVPQKEEHLIILAGKKIASPPATGEYCPQKLHLWH